MEPDFSERLKNYRRAKAMTQQDLADQLGSATRRSPAGSRGAAIPTCRCWSPWPGRWG
ncbi:helix-turn-helix domain-containing protein [Intestinimonas massiliensis]|uniref:Helix-turn-helix domain-containing protein n=1 Tax=Intestinimonas massiliensis (ex Afouda et al. 2020) TaxID=1673721 RepID=A0ABS9M573_9FIRM|nr:helix-turn-helix transcriptional regulator [Intestinimonas massiliensis (ex Afouda et al. 2020)]MCG4525930.1 helix-turn-helix domain-containing protein [Intestinimonas massiliensis (ex Afouda et al. 2020)]